MRSTTITAILTSALCLGLASSADAEDSKRASGPDKATVVATQRLVKTAVIKPLADRDNKRSKFSRAAMPPRERRVRVIEAKLTDKNGRAFTTFAIDSRYSFDEKGEWNEAEWLGCAYLDSKDVFLKRGDEYRPASFLVGKRTEAIPDALCHSSEGEVTAKAAPSEVPTQNAAL